MSNFFERRIAPVGRSGAESRRNLHGVDERHAKNPGIKVYRHFHIISVERQMVNAVKADRTLGVGSAAILNLDIGHGALVFRRIGPDPTIGLSDLMGNAGTSNRPTRSISSSLATL